jgi:hypothetical protein
MDSQRMSSLFSIDQMELKSPELAAFCRLTLNVKFKNISVRQSINEVLPTASGDRTDI